MPTSTNDKLIEDSAHMHDETIACIDSNRAQLVPTLASTRAVVEAIVREFSGEQLLRALEPFEQLLAAYERWRDDLNAFTRDMRDLIGAKP